MLRLSSPVLAAALAMLASASAASAQDSVAPPPSSATDSTIGSPLLRNFELEGTRTTPPAEPQPAPAEPVQPQPRTEAPASAPVERSAPAPVRTTERAAEPAPAAPEAPAPAPTLSEEAFAELYPAGEAAPAPAAVSSPAAGLDQPLIAPEATPDYTLWIALAAGLLLLLGFAFFRSRRRAEPALARIAPVEEPAPAPAPGPQPVWRDSDAAVPPAPRLDDSIRPWLEIDFKPEKLVATDADTSVHFQLLVRNAGQSEARNVRITARMFNPSADQKEAINAFFATPAKAGGQPVTIPPQLAARFKPSVAMPRQSIRMLEVQGRPIFVPTVAINIQYEWGDGRRGQTCKSFLIGTEKNGQPSDKMGAFRLDLGPRIYRHVGGRPLELARAV